MVRYERHVAQAELLSPLKNFEPDSQPIEHRVDPLMGFTSVVRTGRKFWQALYNTDEKLLQELVESSRGRCFFCPEKVASATPLFPKDFIPEGRLVVGEAVVFPNLFAHKEFSAIAVFTKDHYLPLDGFTPGVLLGGFRAAAEYIRRVYEKYRARYAEIGWNYLFTGGASIIHPHLQVILSHQPYYLIKEMDWRARKHLEEHGVNFWEEYLKEEKREGKRYLGAIGNTEWFCPFAPTREDEVNAVVRGRSNFLELKDADWEALAEGLARVLRFYREKGLSSVNMALYSGPLGERSPHLWAGLKIVSRTSAQATPVNDVWYSSNLLLDGFVTDPPEDLAREIRKYFSK